MVPALPAAEAGRLITFGIVPTTAETGYGYIRAGGAAEGSVRSVDRFVEKPDRGDSRTLCDQWRILLEQRDVPVPGFWWFLAELEAHAPQIFTAAGHLQGREIRCRLHRVPMPRPSAPARFGFD